MKKAILATCILAFQMAVAQQYIPISTKNTSWKVIWGNDGGYLNIQGGWWYKTGPDTLMGGNNYTSLINREDESYIGAFYEDSSKRVYYMAADSSTSYLLYDFSAEVGDTITGLFAAPEDTFIVNQVNSFFWQEPKYPELGRKWIFLKKPGLNGGVIGGTWIEGVGSMAGLIDGTYEVAFEQFVSLDCFQIDSISYFFHGCNPLGLSEYYNEDFSLHPNPTSDKIHFEYNGKISGICITDMRGVMMKDIKFNNGELNVSHFPAGIYFIRLMTEATTLTKRFIKN